MRSPSPSLRRPPESARTLSPPPPPPQSYSNPSSLLAGGGGSAAGGDYGNTNDTMAVMSTTPATPSSIISSSSSTTNISVKGAGGSASSRLHEKVSRSRKLRAAIVVAAASSPAAAATAAAGAMDKNNINNKGATNSNINNHQPKGTSAPTSSTTGAASAAPSQGLNNNNNNTVTTTPSVSATPPASSSSSSSLLTAQQHEQQHQSTVGQTMILSAASSSSSVSSTTKNSNNNKRESLSEKRRRAMARVGRLSTTTTAPPSSMAAAVADHGNIIDDSAFLSSSSSTLSSSNDKILAPQQQQQQPSTTQAHQASSGSSVQKLGGTSSSRNKNAAKRLKFKKQKEQQRATAANKEEEVEVEEEEKLVVTATKSGDSSCSVKEEQHSKKDHTNDAADAKKSSITKQQSPVVVGTKKKNEQSAPAPAAAALLVASCAAPKKMEQQQQKKTLPPMTTTTTSAKCVVTMPLAKEQHAASVVCLPSWLKTKNSKSQAATANKVKEADAESSQHSMTLPLATTTTISKQEEEEPPKQARPVVTVPCKNWMPHPPTQRSSSGITPANTNKEKEEVQHHHEADHEEEKKQQVEEDEPKKASSAARLPSRSRSWTPTRQQQRRTLAKEKEAVQEEKKQQLEVEPNKAVLASSEANKESNGPVMGKQQQHPQQPSRNKQDPPAICFPADYYYSRAKNKRTDLSSSVSVTADVGANMNSKNSNTAPALSSKPKLRLAASPSSRTVREREFHGDGDTTITRREEQQASSSSSHRYASPSMQRGSSSSLQQHQQLTPERHNKMLEARRKAASSSPVPPPHPRQSPCNVPPATTSERHQSNVRTKSAASSSKEKVSSSHHQQNFRDQEHALKNEENEEVKSETIVKELQIAETIKATYEEEAVPRSRKDAENGSTTTPGLKKKKKVVEWPMPLVAAAAAVGTEHDELLEATGSKSINTEQATFEEVDNYSCTDSLSFDTFKGKGIKGNNLVKSVNERRKDVGTKDERNNHGVEVNKGRWSPPPIPSASMSSDTVAAESTGPPTISEASSVRDDDEQCEAERCLSPPPLPTFNKTAGGKLFGPINNNMVVEKRQCLSPPRPSMTSSTGAESNGSLSPVPVPPAPPNSAVKGQRNWVPPLPRGGGGADVIVRSPVLYSGKGELFEPPQLRSLGVTNSAANQPHGQPKQGVADRFRRDLPLLGGAGTDVIADNVAPQSNIEQPEKVCVSSMKTRFNQAPGSDPNHHHQNTNTQKKPTSGVGHRSFAPKVLEKPEDAASEAIQETPVIMRTTLPLAASSDQYRRSGLDRRSYSPSFILDESPVIETSQNSNSLRSDHWQARAGVSRNLMDKQATENDDDGYIPRIRPSSGGSSMINNGLSTRPSDRFAVGKKFDSSASDHGSDSVFSMKSRYSSCSNDPRRSPPLNVMQRSKLLERKPLDEEPMLQQSREEPVEGMPNAVIETPAKVNVASMAGMFNQTPGSKGRKTTGSAGKMRSSLAMRSPSPGRRWGSPSPVRRNEAGQVGPKTPSWVKKVDTSSAEDGAVLPMSPSAIKQQTSPVGRSLRSGSGESFSPRGTKSPVPLVSSPRGYAASSNAQSPRNRRRDLQLPNIDEIPSKRVPGGASVMPPTSPRTRLANNKSPVLHHIWDKASHNNDMKRNSNATIRSSSPLRIHDGPIDVESTGNRSQVPSLAIAPRMSTRTQPSSAVFVDGVSTTIPEIPSAESFDCAPVGEHLEQNIKSMPFEVKSPSQAERMSNREMKGDSNVEYDFFTDSTFTQTTVTANHEFKATQFDAADHDMSQLEHKVDDRKVITGDSTNNGHRPPTAPGSPTSPSKTEKPWQKDLRILSPRSWQKHAPDEVQNEVSKVREHLKKPRESDENSRTSTPTAQNLTSPFTNAKKSVLVFDGDSYGEEKKSNKGDDALLPPTAPSSLPRLAADSVHAVDYDQAIQGMMRKSATQSSSMEMDEYSSGSRGAIPKELPPEFAQALDSKGGGGESVAASPNPVVGKEDKSESESETEIVFGDPLTYGAAGGEAEKSPPRVSDRAKAIAAWKGGLGVKAKHKETESQKSRKSSQSQDKDIAAFFDDSSGGKIDGRPERVSASNSGRRGSPTRSVESRDSKAAAVPAGQQASRGASAVLRFWASTSQDEVADAQDWKDRDPDVAEYSTDIPESPFDSGKLTNKLMKKVADGGFATTVPDDGFTIEKVTDDAFGGFHSTKDSVMDDVFGDFGATNNNSNGRLAGGASAEQGKIVDLRGAQKISGWNDVSTSSLPEMGLAPFSLENTAVVFSNTAIPKDDVNMFNPFSDEPDPDINDFGRPDDFFTGGSIDGFGSAPFPAFASTEKQAISGSIPDGFNTSSFLSFDTGSRRAAAGKSDAAVQKLEEALNAIAPSQDFDDENKPKNPSSFTANDGFDPFGFPEPESHFDTSSSSKMAMKARHDSGAVWSFDQAVSSFDQASSKGTRFDVMAALQKEEDDIAPRAEI